MIYLYLDKNRIKFLSLAKTFLGQYQASYFQKAYKTNLLEKGKVINVDLLASAIKEILLYSPEIKDKDVCLILPQDSFEFARYDVPEDISEIAIMPFIKSKINAKIDFLLEEGISDYIISKQNEGASKVLFFVQDKAVFAKYNQALQLLGLIPKFIIPETLCYFKIFEKTLKKEKKENILYVSYEKQFSFGYLYDSLGLLKKERYYFEEFIENSLKQTAEELIKEDLKLNRIILSGANSDSVRQDIFTKKVGVWTNSFKKIIANFYQDYLKLIIAPPGKSLPLLDFDVCLGAFILSRDNKLFSAGLPVKNQEANHRFEIKKLSKPLKFLNLRDIVIFIISFIISFVVIFSFKQLNLSKIKEQLSKQKKEKTASLSSSPAQVLATPTPKITLDKTKFKIKVLNGAGIKGKAMEVKEILKNKGYSEILTGNASAFNYEKTELEIKDDKKEAASILISDLSENVNLKVISSLEENSSADAVLTIGKDFK